MIRIRKDLKVIPNSLNDEETEEKRNICIDERLYKSKFNKWYKQKDTKEALKRVYKNKCAFCEQKIFKSTDDKMRDDTSTVEHYRPKTQYYWLAFSWDNLLWCCHGCNKNKGHHFEVLASRVECDKSFQKRVHSSVNLYQRVEKPKMIHVELENIVNELHFKKGVIDSNNDRIKYTIDVCRLNRLSLNEKRKSIIDKFVKEVNAKKAKNESINDILISLLDDVTREEKEFIALRYWILRNYKSLIGVTHV